MLAAILIVVGGVVATGLLLPSKKGQLFLKLALLVVYIAMAAVAADTYHAASVADSTGVSGSTTGSFGDLWLLVLAGLFVVAVVLHVVLYVRSKRVTTPAK